MSCDTDYVREWAKENLEGEGLLYYTLGLTHWYDTNSNRWTNGTVEDNIRDYFRKKIIVKELIRTLNKRKAKAEWSWIDELREMRDDKYEIPHSATLQRYVDDSFDSKMKEDAFDDNVSLLLEKMIGSEEYKRVEGLVEDSESEVFEAAEEQYFSERILEGGTLLTSLEAAGFENSSHYQQLDEIITEAAEEGHWAVELDELEDALYEGREFLDELKTLGKIMERETDGVKMEEHRRFQDLFVTLNTPEYVKSGVGQANKEQMYRDYIRENINNARMAV